MLGNADKRALYDSGGIALVKEAATEEAQGGAASNPLAALFGARMGGQGREKKQAKKGPDHTMTMPITLAQLYNGDTGTLILTIETQGCMCCEILLSLIAGGKRQKRQKRQNCFLATCLRTRLIRRMRN